MSKNKMIKNIKVCLCFLFTFVILMNTGIFVFAIEDIEETEITTEEPENPVEPEEPTEPEEPIDPNENVAVIYLCTVAFSKHYPCGHAWICIENISERELTIGEQKIAPGETISAGLHPGKGMIFNREMEKFNGKKVKACQTTVTMEIFEAVCNEMQKTKWGWYEFFAHNCTNFASAVWNAATGKHTFPFCFPFVIIMQMRDTFQYEIK